MSNIKYAIGMDTNSIHCIDAVKYENVTKTSNCFEWIPDTPVKVYLDVDIKKSVEDGEMLIEEAPRLLDGLKDCLAGYFAPNFDINQVAITESHSPRFIPNKGSEEISKVSFGFIINNMIATKSQQKLLVKKLNEYAKQHMDKEDINTFYSSGVFDSALYSSEGKQQKVRSVYASKPSENRPKRLIHGEFHQSVITAFIPTDAIQLDIPVPEKKQKLSHHTEIAPKELTENRLIFDSIIRSGLLTQYAQSGRYADWMRIGWAIKNEFDDKTLWHQFSSLGGSAYDQDQCNDVWEKMQKTGEVGFGTIIHYAKQTDEDKVKKIYKEIRQKIYFISTEDIEDPYKTALIISPTLKKSLVLCNENWYMLTESQLWKQQKEPSYYITNELRKYIDESNQQIVEKIAKTDGEQKEKLIEKSKSYLASYKKISSSSFLNVLTKYLKTLLNDDKFANKLDANSGFLAFQNGIVNLQTKKFREGIIASDFITQTIPNNYSPADDAKKEYVKSVLLKILNNNSEHLEYLLSLIGFSFIGQPNLEKSIYFCVDKTTKSSGDNGKTFLFDILTTLLPNYVYKSKGSFLEEGNNKVHKQLAMMKGMRLVWADEFGKKKANSELIKELGDGLKIENEVMFGTSETINILFKMWILTNNLPLIDPKDTAVYNRYKQISYGSHFDRTGTRTEEDPENLLFIADTKLGDKIKQEYYNEIFALIIEYANKYYLNKLPPIPAQFLKDTKETQDSNDEFGQWFSDYCIIDPNARVALDAIVESSGFNKKLAKEGMTRFGFKYDKDLSKLGKDYSGKAYKGGYCGVMLKPIEDEIESIVNED